MSTNSSTSTSASTTGSPVSSTISGSNSLASGTATNASSFTPPVTPTLLPSPSMSQAGPPNQANNNNGNNIATSASLYLYTFLATLVLLLSVSAAIVIRSFILRRRHRLMVEEAIRNGTWVPPAPPTRPARVDLSKKPVLWEAYIDGKGSVAAMGAQGKWYTPGGAALAGPGKAINQDWRIEQTKEWDMIKPFSAAYVIPGAAAAPNAASTTTLPMAGRAPSTTSINRVPSNDAESPANPGPPPGPIPVPAPVSSQLPQPQPPLSVLREPRRRAFLSSAMRMFNPTPAPTSPLPAPVTSGSSTDADGNGAAHAMAELHSRTTPTAMRVAVLIAMPSPPSGHNLAASSSTSSASVAQIDGGVSHPLQPAPAGHIHDNDEEQPLPHLEMGVAEVLVVPSELAVYGETDGKGGKRDLRGSVGSRESRESDASEV